MRVAYPTFIKPSGDDFLVYVPDLEIYTEGKDFADAIYMARDAIGLAITSLQDDKEPIPEPSNHDAALKKAKDDADDIFDYSDGTFTYVDIDPDEYRRRVLTRSVRKNCTIPSWLNEKAEAQGVNFSRVLQDALVNIVGEN